MLIYFATSNIYKYAFPLFLSYSFDNDDIKSSKRHVVLLSVIFLLKCLYKSFLISWMRGNISKTKTPLRSSFVLKALLLKSLNCF